MSLYNNLVTEIEKGLKGKNGSIPFPIAKLDEYIDIAKNTNYLLVGDTGCLAGDTIINLTRGKHKCRKYSIQDLFHKFKGIRNNKSQKAFIKWNNKNIKTSALCYNYDSDLIYYNTLINVFQSGIKDTFTVTTQSGKKIRTTKDHKFLVSKNNIFLPLSKLSVGSKILVQSSSQSKEIHHIDENINNNDKSNLVLISKKEHAKLHGKKGKSKHFGNRHVVEDIITEISYFGKEMTYDISMQSPNNNFVANKFIVHNSGKTTMAHDLILNILDWYYENESNDLKLSIIYFGMERKQYNYSAKWVSRMIFKNEGILIPVRKILGRQRKRDENGKLTKEYDLLSTEEVDLIKHYAKIFDKWEETGTFICIEGTHNPTGLKIFIDKFAKEHGEIKDREGGPLGKQKYIPNHENHIVLIVTDYVGVLDKEKDDQGIKKNRLDIFSSIMRRARDLYGFSPINIQQLSRSLADVSRIKLNDVKPRLTDIADTSELARDADVVIAIFEPYRYLPENTETDLIGYNLLKLKDQKGYKYYRTLHILKSSFEGDGITMGCAFMPQIGIILPMPKNPRDMTEDDYSQIINTQYFLK